jgi:hypothetical protein
VQIALPPGETCFYKINATCGIPNIGLNSTTGFDVQSVDYDDDDGLEVGDDTAATKNVGDKTKAAAKGIPKRN